MEIDRSIFCNSLHNFHFLLCILLKIYIFIFQIFFRSQTRFNDAPFVAQKTRPKHPWNCRNTVQGKEFVTDDKGRNQISFEDAGYTCNRLDLAKNKSGCCDPSKPTSVLHSCSHCGAVSKTYCCQYPYDTCNILHYDVRVDKI